MNWGKSQNELEKELDENSEGRLRMTEANDSLGMT